ncbi:oxidoreductase [Salmonella enterica]|nr:oxidoreductase [Salmonella enterica]
MLNIPANWRIQLIINAYCNDFLKLLYAPLFYTDKSYLSALPDGKGEFSDKLLNYWLINYYKLDHLTDDFQHKNTDIITTLFIHNWLLLPKVAYLIGSYIGRRLSYEGIFLFPDSYMFEFMSLPLLYQAESNHLIQPDIISTGVSYLLNLGKGLPVALKQRFLLCFPKSINCPELDIPKTQDNINLLKIAISYAKNM